MLTQQPLDLRGYFNAHGATYDGARSKGTLNAWGNSLPAEELPFGSSLTLGGVAYRLAAKADGFCDHIEALGQSIALADPLPARGLSALACGEMGDQELDAELVDRRGGRTSMRLVAPAWLVPRVAPLRPDGLRSTHLHYSGGYELDVLQPVLWSVTQAWRSTMVLTAIRLGLNPLFHIFAITLIVAGVSDD